MQDNLASEALAAARRAMDAGNHETALERYAWVFDHCLEIDPSFYGVRLSYVLDEWAELGDTYLPAADALETRLQAAVQRVAAAPSHENFHDLVAIARVCGKPEEVVQTFVQLLATDPTTAARVFSLAWEMLYESGELDLCSRCIPSPSRRYASILQDYDDSLKHARPEWIDYPEWVVTHYRTRSAMLVDILRRTGRQTEADDLAARIASDTRERPLLAGDPARS